MSDELPITFKIVHDPLEAGQFVDEPTAKRQIFLHHTASSADPHAVVRWWSKSRAKIATSFVIGGRSKLRPQHDGRIVQAFDAAKWAWHLGIKKEDIARSNLRGASAAALDKHSIGIELCNWGPLTHGPRGFENYVKGRVPDDEVIELAEPFRGYRHYHRYSEAQLAALARLLRALAERWQIPLEYKGERMFSVCPEALRGEPGIWTHASVRADKFDCSPQPALMAMLRSLSASKTESAPRRRVDLQDLFREVERIGRARDDIRSAIADMNRFGDEGARYAAIATTIGAVLMTLDILRVGMSAVDSRAAAAFDAIDGATDAFGRIEERVTGAKSVFVSRSEVLAGVDPRFAGIVETAGMVRDAKAFLDKLGIKNERVAPLLDVATRVAEDTALMLSAAQTERDVREQTGEAIVRARAALRRVDAQLRAAQERLGEAVRFAELAARTA